MPWPISRSPAPAASAAGDTHLVLYDGVCVLCSYLVRFIVRHDRRGVFRFASLQSEVGRAMVTRSGGDANQLATLYVVARFETPQASLLTKSAAAVFVVGELGWPWKAARVARVVPLTLRNRVYDFVAATRYAVFGRREACLLPPPEVRSRFLDEEPR